MFRVLKTIVQCCSRVVSDVKCRVIRCIRGGKYAQEYQCFLMFFCYQIGVVRLKIQEQKNRVKIEGVEGESSDRPNL